MDLDLLDSPLSSSRFPSLRKNVATELALCSEFDSPGTSFVDDVALAPASADVSFLLMRIVFLSS